MRLLLITYFAVLAYGQDDLYFRKPEKLIKSSNSVGERLGEYALTYETEGGILHQETGKRKYEGTDSETQLIQGSVQYNAPDGTPVAISWTADEFGTQVSGTHLPTPPPIPPAIARALEWLAKQPSTTEEPTDLPPVPPPKPIEIKKQQFNKPLPLKKQPFLIRA